MKIRFGPNLLCAARCMAPMAANSDAAQDRPDVVLLPADNAGYGEMGLHEDLNVGGNFIWAMEPALKAVMEYEATLKDHPNPKPANVTNLGRD